MDIYLELHSRRYKYNIIYIPRRLECFCFYFVCFVFFLFISIFFNTRNWIQCQCPKSFCLFFCFLFFVFCFLFFFFFHFDSRLRKIIKNLNERIMKSFVFILSSLCGRWTRFYPHTNCTIKCIGMISCASSNLLIQIQIIEREKRKRGRDIEECRRWWEYIWEIQNEFKKKLGYITLIL